jgi:hypothetical protein
MYLYYHYSSFPKVEEIMRNRYIHSDTVQKDLRNEIILAIKYSYVSLTGQIELPESRVVLDKIE